MKIVAISDVHEQWHSLRIPECNILVSAGDYSYRGDKKVVIEFHKWLSKQPAKHIISVQGNHELWVESNWGEAVLLVKDIDPKISFTYTGSIVVEGVKIYCSAVTPFFGNWAWNVERGEKIRRYWDLIPDDTQVLVTHGPPYGVLDQIQPSPVLEKKYRSSVLEYHPSDHLGCEELRKILRNRLLKLKLHIFGHIHGSSGILDDAVHEHSNHRILFVNAAICDEKYKPKYSPKVIEIDF